MTHRILIAAVAALSMAGVTAASAEYDSAGVGTINPERYGYQSGNATQKYAPQGQASGSYASGGYVSGGYVSGGYASGGYADDGYMAYGSANTRVRTQDSYMGPRTSYQHRSHRGW